MAETKPTNTARWATDANRTTTPSSGEQDTGHVVDTKPAAKKMNWLQNLYYQWIRWINERFFDGPSSGDFEITGVNVTTGTDIDGGDLEISGGSSTGSGHSVCEISAAVAGASGTAVRSPEPFLTADGSTNRLEAAKVIDANPTGTNDTAIIGNGQGLGAGIRGNGGASGAGVIGYGGLTSGDGGAFWAQGGNRHGAVGSGEGSGSGLIGNGGSTGGPGCTATGGAVSGTGLVANGGGPNGHGVVAQGDGSGEGIIGNGGDSDGTGVIGNGGTTNGDGVAGNATGTGVGVKGIADTTGSGVQGTGGSTSGAGVVGNAIAGNSNGVEGTGNGTGVGGKFTGGTTGSNVNLVPRTEPTGAQGDLIVNSTNGKLQNHNGTEWERQVPQTKAITADEQETSYTTLQEFVSSRYTIPAGTLRVGSTIRVLAAGNVSVNGTNHTLGIQLTEGAGPTSDLCDAAVSATGDFFYEAIVTVQSLGASGAFRAQCQLASGSTGGAAGSIAVGTTAVATPTFDTTGDINVAFWGAASTASTTNLRQFIVDVT